MIVDIQEKRLGIEPLAQAMLLQTPTPGCIIMAGWTVERWDILSSELSPGNPCSLAQKWKCIIEQNLDKYAANVQWIFYSSCERWYHQISPRCASTTMVTTVAGWELASWEDARSAKSAWDTFILGDETSLVGVHVQEDQGALREVNHLLQHIPGVHHELVERLGISVAVHPAQVDRGHPLVV